LKYLPLDIHVWQFCISYRCLVHIHVCYFFMNNLMVFVFIYMLMHILQQELINKFKGQTILRNTDIQGLSSTSKHYSNCVT